MTFDEGGVAVSLQQAFSREFPVLNTTTFGTPTTPTPSTTLAFITYHKITKRNLVLALQTNYFDHFR